MLTFRGTVDYVVAAVQAAPERRDPFRHLELGSVLPAEAYAAMMQAMPSPGSYGEMSGRARRTRTAAGGSARTKVDLFPEGTLGLPRGQREVWSDVGRVLRSPAVRGAFMRRLAPGLEQRFGTRHAQVPLYPVPILTRDVPGYRIGIHTDTRWKGITVQIYLPADTSIAHVGTVFHRRRPEGKYEVAKRMSFAPNSGYAFAVGTDTFHSVDLVGPEVATRDSILLTYFVDETLFHMAKNRFKRIGNLARGLGWRR